MVEYIASIVVAAVALIALPVPKNKTVAWLLVGVKFLCLTAAIYSLNRLYYRLPFIPGQLGFRCLPTTLAWWLALWLSERKWGRYSSRTSYFKNPFLQFLNSVRDWMVFVGVYILDTFIITAVVIGLWNLFQ